MKKRILSILFTILMAVALVPFAVVGAGGFALVWFVIKKKSWADLLAVFKKN